MKAVVYTQSGTKKGDTDLNPDLFEVELNETLIHQSFVRQQANARRSTAQVKTRAMVRGGGRKPFKQKGTGRARQGTIRAPQMRGGGVVFGPTGNENYSKQMPKKMRRKALFSALSVRAAGNGVAVLNKFDIKAPSTKAFKKFVETTGLGRKILVIAPEKDFILEKSTSNLPNVKTITAQYLNIVDVMQSDILLFLEDGLKKTEEVFTS